MRRRRLLAVAGATVAAGCTGRTGTPGGQNETDGTTTLPSVTDRSVETVDTGCGSDSTASVSFGSASVTVSGSVPSSDPCHRATLAEASYDADADELSVTVGATAEGDGPCVQCLGVVDYEATVSFADGLPGRVVVSHAGLSGTERVTTATR